MPRKVVQKQARKLHLSILDLVPTNEGEAPARSFARMRELAILAETLGFHRYFIAEHHNTDAMGSSATVILMTHVAQATERIRIAAGGIMLPNHAPLVVAEQFVTLNALFPNRIDLGVGRASGADRLTAAALRRGVESPDFATDVLAIRRFLSPPRAPRDAASFVRVTPGRGAKVPLIVLGASEESATFAGGLGVAYAFAGHIFPARAETALEAYRRSFVPRGQLRAPYTMMSAHVVLADTDTRARFLATTLERKYVALLAGLFEGLRPPTRNVRDIGTKKERVAILPYLDAAIVGGPKKAKQDLDALVARTGVDEILATSDIYDHEERMHSMRLLASLHEAGSKRLPRRRASPRG